MLEQEKGDEWVDCVQMTSLVLGIVCTHSEQVLSDGCTTWVLEIPCLMCVPFVGLCATAGNVQC